MYGVGADVDDNFHVLGQKSSLSMISAHSQSLHLLIIPFKWHYSTMPDSQNIL